MRILVVEDEQLARQALQQILEQDGHEVLAAANGHVAMSTLTTFDPHVIITDWRLPDVSGEQLCREFRRTHPTVPIIITSSAEEAFSSPVDVDIRLRKPLDVRRLREVLDAQRSTSPRRRAASSSSKSSRSRLPRL